jgi:hypothetical protein
VILAAMTAEQREPMPTTSIEQHQTATLLDMERSGDTYTTIIEQNPTVNTEQRSDVPTTTIEQCEPMPVVDIEKREPIKPPNNKPNNKPSKHTSKHHHKSNHKHR